jgi:hypothetical protein
LPVFSPCLCASVVKSFFQRVWPTSESQRLN